MGRNRNQDLKDRKAKAVRGIERFAEWLRRERLLEKARADVGRSWGAMFAKWERANSIQSEWHFIRTGWRLP